MDAGQSTHGNCFRNADKQRETASGVVDSILIINRTVNRYKWAFWYQTMWIQVLSPALAESQKKLGLFGSDFFTCKNNIAFWELFLRLNEVIYV